MKLRPRVSTAATAAAIAGGLAGLPLAAALISEDRGARTILFVVAGVAGVSLGALWIWQFVLTTVEVSAGKLSVSTLGRKRSWDLAADTVAVKDFGHCFHLLLRNSRGRFVLVSGRFVEQPPEIEAIVSRARRQNACPGSGARPR